MSQETDLKVFISDSGGLVLKANHTLFFASRFVIFFCLLLPISSLFLRGRREKEHKLK
jgi:hypothetical protein